MIIQVIVSAILENTGSNLKNKEIKYFHKTENIIFGKPKYKNIKKLWKRIN